MTRGIKIGLTMGGIVAVPAIVAIVVLFVGMYPGNVAGAGMSQGRHESL